MRNTRNRSAKSGRCRPSARRKTPSCCRYSASDGGLRLPLRVRVQDQLAQFALRRRVDDGAEEREATPFAVDVVLACRECDVAAATTAALLLPDGKSDQLQSIERSVVEVQFGFCEFTRWVVPVVRRNLDGHGDCSLWLGESNAERGFKGDAATAEAIADSYDVVRPAVSGVAEV